MVNKEDTMMRKKPFIILALSLAGLLASCSYGGTSVVSHDEFVNFYSEENLASQDSYAFVLGDAINISASSTDEEENIVSQSFILSSGSISTWDSNLSGSALSFASSMVKKNSSGVQLEGDKTSSSVSFSATTVADNENENIVTDASTYTYKYNIDQVDGEEYTGSSTQNEKNNYHECRVITQTDFKSVSSYSEDYGITPSVVTTTWSSTISSLSIEVAFDSGSGVTTTTKREATYNFQYDEVEPKVGASYSVLTYYNKTVNTVYSEILDNDNAVVSGTKTIATIIEQTSFNSLNDDEPTGSRTDRHSVYNWVTNDYVKDEASSSETIDDAYVYQVAASYLDSLTASSFLSTWKQLDELDHFLLDLSSYYNHLFIDFETYLAGDAANEEIVRDGLTYQYRSRLGQVSDNLTIIQYTFVKSSDEGKRTVLTDVSLLLVNTSADEVTTLSRISLVY